MVRPSPGPASAGAQARVKPRAGAPPSLPPPPSSTVTHPPADTARRPAGKDGEGVDQATAETGAVVGAAEPPGGAGGASVRVRGRGAGPSPARSPPSRRPRAVTREKRGGAPASKGGAHAHWATVSPGGGVASASGVGATAGQTLPCSPATACTLTRLPSTTASRPPQGVRTTSASGMGRVAKQTAAGSARVGSLMRREEE